MVAREKVKYHVTLYHPSEGIIMVKSCILVCCKLLKTKRVVELAKKQPGVKDAFPVHGRWDVAIATDDLELQKIADIGMVIYKAEGVEIVETLVGYPEM
jgi:hypothetical protein